MAEAIELNGTIFSVTVIIIYLGWKETQHNRKKLGKILC